MKKNNKFNKIEIKDCIANFSLLNKEELKKNLEKEDYPKPFIERTLETYSYENYPITEDDCVFTLKLPNDILNFYNHCEQTIVTGLNISIKKGYCMMLSITEELQKKDINVLHNNVKTGNIENLIITLSHDSTATNKRDINLIKGTPYVNIFFIPLGLAEIIF